MARTYIYRPVDCIRIYNHFCLLCTLYDMERSPGIYELFPHVEQGLLDGQKNRTDVGMGLFWQSSDSSSSSRGGMQRDSCCIGSYTRHPHPPRSSSSNALEDT